MSISDLIFTTKFTQMIHALFDQNKDKKQLNFLSLINNITFSVSTRSSIHTKDELLNDLYGKDRFL